MDKKYFSFNFFIKYILPTTITLLGLIIAYINLKNDEINTDLTIKEINKIDLLGAKNNIIEQLSYKKKFTRINDSKNETVSSFDFLENLNIKLGNQELSNFYICLYELENTGNTHIKPDDFIKPLSIDVENGWNLFGLLMIPNPGIETDELINPNSTNNKVGKFLINSGQKINIFLYVSRYKSNLLNIKDLNKPPEIFFSANIVGVNSLYKTENKDKYSFLDIFHTKVILINEDVHIFLFFSTLIYFIHIIILRKVDNFSERRFFYINSLLSFAFSMSTAEIIVFLLKLRKTIPIYWFSYVFLSLNFLYIVYIIYLGFYKKNIISKQN